MNIRVNIAIMFFAVLIAFSHIFWSSRRVTITKQSALRSSLLMEITIIVQDLLDMLFSLEFHAKSSCSTFPFNFSGITFKMYTKHKSRIPLNWKGASVGFAIDSNFKDNKPLKLTKNPSVCWSKHILDSSINCYSNSSQPYRMTI